MVTLIACCNQGIVSQELANELAQPAVSVSKNKQPMSSKLLKERKRNMPRLVHRAHPKTFKIFKQLPFLLPICSADKEKA